MTDTVFIHETAEVSPFANVGLGTRIWHHVHIRERATIGRQCILGKGVYVDFGVEIGDRCKIQNGAFLYHGVTLEEGVFVGPGVLFTNDRVPRAITPEGDLKAAEDWEAGSIRVRRGASVGAGAIILPGVEIGRWAMIGAGAVVTRDVPDHGLVLGNPARLMGFVCRCGRRLRPDPTGTPNRLLCPVCNWALELPHDPDRPTDHRP